MRIVGILPPGRHSLCVINPIAADGLVTQGARTLAVMVLTGIFSLSIRSVKFVHFWLSICTHARDTSSVQVLSCVPGAPYSLFANHGRLKDQNITVCSKRQIQHSYGNTQFPSNIHTREFPVPFAKWKTKMDSSSHNYVLLFSCLFVTHVDLIVLVYVWLILGLRPASERRRYSVTTSLIGSAQA